MSVADRANARLKRLLDPSPRKGGARERLSLFPRCTPTDAESDTTDAILRTSVGSLCAAFTSTLEQLAEEVRAGRAKQLTPQEVCGTLIPFCSTLLDATAGARAGPEAAACTCDVVALVRSLLDTALLHPEAHISVRRHAVRLALRTAVAAEAWADRAESAARALVSSVTFHPSSDPTESAETMAARLIAAVDWGALTQTPPRAMPDSILEPRHVLPASAASPVAILVPYMTPNAGVDVDTRARESALMLRDLLGSAISAEGDFLQSAAAHGAIVSTLACRIQSIVFTTAVFPRWYGRGAAPVGPIHGPAVLGFLRRVLRAHHGLQLAALDDTVRALCTSLLARPVADGNATTVLTAATALRDWLKAPATPAHRIAARAGVLWLLRVVESGDTGGQAAAAACSGLDLEVVDPHQLSPEGAALLWSVEAWSDLLVDLACEPTLADLDAKGREACVRHLGRLVTRVQGTPITGPQRHRTLAAGVLPSLSRKFFYALFALGLPTPDPKSAATQVCNALLTPVWTTCASLVRDSPGADLYFFDCWAAMLLQLGQRACIDTFAGWSWAVSSAASDFRQDLSAPPPVRGLFAALDGRGAAAVVDAMVTWLDVTPTAAPASSTVLRAVCELCLGSLTGAAKRRVSPASLLTLAAPALRASLTAQPRALREAAAEVVATLLNHAPSTIGIALPPVAAAALAAAFSNCVQEAVERVGAGARGALPFLARVVARLFPAQEGAATVLEHGAFDPVIHAATAAVFDALPFVVGTVGIMSPEEEEVGGDRDAVEANVSWVCSALHARAWAHELRVACEGADAELHCLAEVRRALHAGRSDAVRVLAIGLAGAELSQLRRGAPDYTATIWAPVNSGDATILHAVRGTIAAMLTGWGLSTIRDAAALATPAAADFIQAAAATLLTQLPQMRDVPQALLRVLTALDVLERVIVSCVGPHVLGCPLLGGDTAPNAGTATDEHSVGTLIADVIRCTRHQISRSAYSIVFGPNGLWAVPYPPLLAAGDAVISTVGPLAPCVWSGDAAAEARVSAAVHRLERALFEVAVAPVPTMTATETGASNDGESRGSVISHSVLPQDAALRTSRDACQNPTTHITVTNALAARQWTATLRASELLWSAPSSLPAATAPFVPPIHSGTVAEVDESEAWWGGLRDADASEAHSFIAAPSWAVPADIHAAAGAPLSGPPMAMRALTSTALLHEVIGRAAPREFPRRRLAPWRGAPSVGLSRGAASPTPLPVCDRRIVVCSYGAAAAADAAAHLAQLLVQLSSSTEAAPAAATLLTRRDRLRVDVAPAGVIATPSSAAAAAMLNGTNAIVVVVASHRALYDAAAAMDSACAASFGGVDPATADDSPATPTTTSAAGSADGSSGSGAATADPVVLFYVLLDRGLGVFHVKRLGRGAGAAKVYLPSAFPVVDGAPVASIARAAALVRAAVTVPAIGAAADMEERRQMEYFKAEALRASAAAAAATMTGASAPTLLCVSSA